MQVVANGIISGLTISLLAVAFSAVYVPTRVFYIALGAIYAAVPFVALEGIRRGAPMVLSIVVAVAVGVALSLLCEVASHRILARRRAGEGVQMVAAIGAYIVIVQAVVLLWGNETKVLTQGISTPIHLGDVTLSTAQVVAGSIAIVLLALFALFLKHTAIGLRFRALAENPSEFALRGHSVTATRALAFGLSGLFASASALVMANDVGFSAHGGLPALLPAVVATIIGGRMSFLGGAIGGIMLGLVRAEVVWHMGARWQEPATFLVLIIFLLMRPGGVFSREMRLEAQT